MSAKMRSRAAALVVAVVVSMLMSVGVAAAGLSRPVLLSPHAGQKVHAGKITLIVKDTGVLKGFKVYVTVSPQRKFDKYGHLKDCGSVAKGCDFVGLQRRRHHSGQWTYTGTFTFPGYWAVTPGKYYWQAQHVDCNAHDKSCEVVSKLGAFRVVP